MTDKHEWKPIVYICTGCGNELRLEDFDHVKYLPEGGCNGKPASSPAECSRCNGTGSVVAMSVMRKVRCTCMPETFGELLKSSRESAGMSQRYLASVLGVSHVFIGSVERGTAKFPVQRLADLKQLLPCLQNLDLHVYQLSVPEF